MTTHTIFLIRHGITEWIEQGIVHGSLDSPLSEHGQWEAQQTANALAGCNITHIYCSPQGRAMETASFLAQKFPDATFTQLNGLKEMDLGKMEGKRDLSKKYKKYPLLALIILPIWFVTRGVSGEKQAHLKERTAEAWTRILAEENEGNIAIFSHGIALNALTSQIPFKDPAMRKKRQRFHTCSITQVEVDETRQAKITSSNNITHLEKASMYAN